MKFRRYALVVVILLVVAAVIFFGVVLWASPRKTRVRLITIRSGLERASRIFAFCHQMFQPRLVQPDFGGPFCGIPQNIRPRSTKP